MNNLINAYLQDVAEKLETAPDAERINRLWVKGYITYSEAVKMLLEDVERAKYDYIIQYQKDNGGRYRDYCDTLYTYREALDEVNRLQDAAPAMNWRYKRIKKTA